MTITTLDGAIAGMQDPMSFAKAVGPTMLGPPWYQSLWYLAGNPGAGLSPAVTAGGVVLAATSTNRIAGQIYRNDAGSGNNYLARFTGAASQAGTLWLMDRLLQAGGNSAGAAIGVTNATAAQTIFTAALPPRDILGQTNGAGIYAAVEVITGTGAGAPTLTMTYTNSAGVVAHSATNIINEIASSPIGSWYPIGLQAGDAGVRSVTSLQLGVSWTSGTIAVVLYRPLVALELPGAYIPNAVDALTAGFPQLFNGTCPFLVFQPSVVTAATVSGTYIETQG